MVIRGLNPRKLLAAFLLQGGPEVCTRFPGPEFCIRSTWAASLRPVDLGRKFVPDYLGPPCICIYIYTRTYLCMCLYLRLYLRIYLQMYLYLFTFVYVYE